MSAEGTLRSRKPKIQTCLTFLSLLNLRIFASFLSSLPCDFSVQLSSQGEPLVLCINNFQPELFHMSVICLDFLVLAQDNKTCSSRELQCLSGWILLYTTTFALFPLLWLYSELMLL